MCRALLRNRIRQLVAKILNGRREYEAAFRQTSIVKELISRMGNSPLFTYFTLLDEAHFHFEAGKERHALEVLRSALAIGRAYHYKTLTDCWQPAVLAGLCAKALENDIETAYVQDLIRSLNLIPDAPPWISRAGHGELRFTPSEDLNSSGTELPSSSQEKPKGSLSICSKRCSLTEGKE